MRVKYIISLITIFIVFNNKSLSQEGLPIYSDYLTDNYYLLYPSMAGVSHITAIGLNVSDVPS